MTKVEVCVQSDYHQPVLLNEVIESYSIHKKKKGLSYLDGTFGRGGHFAKILEVYHPETLVACDQDITAINYGKQKYPEARFEHKNFYEFAQTNQDKFDMILIDLGVSSPQLDNAERGFSFNKDGPLDMRMNQSAGITAADLINTAEDTELVRIFTVYGEVLNPTKVVRAIVADRKIKPFQTTAQLAGLIERVDGWRKKGFHPATQYFMALRLVVNKELEVTEQAIPLFLKHLKDGGRLSVITFHSLEDRIIKNIFKDSSEGFLVNKKVIVPSEEECTMNPRARSAKLRIFQKGLPAEKPDKFALRRMGLR